MPNIFISYRRSESAYAVHAIYTKLVSRYGESSVMFDVDSIPLGVDFIDYLNNEVSRCDVLLAVIGQNWLDVRGENGQRRLDDPDDYVRIEIRAALDRDIPVIPVLVDGATMPNPAELPEYIRAIARRNAISVTPGRNFQHEVETLERGLERWFEQLDSRGLQDVKQSFIVHNWIATLVALVAAGVAGSLLLSAVSIPYNNAAIAGVPMANTGLLNACMYGVAIIAGIYISAGMWLTISRYRPGEKIEDCDARQFAHSAFGLPFHIPLFVFVLWVGSGVIIPVFLAITKPDVGITIHHFVQFLSVQTFLGAIAAAITFYLLAETILRFIYPAYAMKTESLARRQLGLLDRLAPVATAILVGLPLPTFTVMVVVAFVFGAQPGSEWQMWWLAVPFMVLTTFLSLAISGRRLSALRDVIRRLGGN